ncbi:MAG: VOC family protein [Pseudomonadales bacterium]
MPLKLLANSIEVGIVTTQIEPMMEFYQDLLGLTLQGEMAFPGGHMQRFSVGDNIIKLVTYDTPPAHSATMGGTTEANGYRYISLVISNLLEVIDQLQEAGYTPYSEITPFAEGVSYAFIQDPDGNALELIGIG